jgi:hypothetical protein
MNLASDRQIRGESLDQPRAPKYRRLGGFRKSYHHDNCKFLIRESHFQSLITPDRLARHRLPSDLRFRVNGVSVRVRGLYPEGVLSRRVLASRKLLYLSVTAPDQGSA